MQIKIIESAEQLLGCESEWNRVAGNRCFFSWNWCVQWFTSFANASDRPYVIVGHDDNQWLGIAPLMISGRKLRFLGSGTACSDYANLITSKHHYNHFAESVAKWMATQFAQPGDLDFVDIFEIEGCGENDRNLDYFCELLTINDFGIHETETEGTWKVHLPETFEQLKATFSKSMRRKTKAARKRLAESDNTKTYADTGNFRSVWQTFVSLHQKRRHSLGQQGCFSDNRFENFLRSAVSELLDRDLADLITISKSDQPIAAVLLLYCGDTCMMYQSGLDPNFSAQEPGYQSVMLSIEHAIAKGCKHFDFLRGDEPYKARWGTTREAIVRRKFIPPNMSAQLKHNTWKIGKTIKDCVYAY